MTEEISMDEVGKGQGEQPAEGSEAVGVEAARGTEVTGRLPRWEGKARAKVNLVLRILAREEDGFHQIETEFQTLDLADDISIELSPSEGVSLEVEGVPAGDLGEAEDNLAVRAARSWLEAYADLREPHAAMPFPGIRIRLHKAIPHGAGLGGGSSDAGAVLRGLDELHGNPLGRGRLVELGSALGSDVPFFVLDEPRALGWGRGDRLLPLSALPARPVLVALPPFRISTPRAYRTLAGQREREGLGWAGGRLLEPEELNGWSRVMERSSNDFEAALERLHPELLGIRQTLDAFGARPARLSGSGSAVFGVFESESDMEEARRELRAVLPEARVIPTRTAAG
ncbi:MAG: 4-(cytidine 5'-diphospho)-2-C-methyl-D-erythritol kinase [Gemmatimonadales bacterium]|nr:MAG: 4-(cytidine 5'-diphospho)-2-C-methyl-D-erythritol kinase [Gemmatimonadales bacterium]